MTFRVGQRVVCVVEPEGWRVLYQFLYGSDEIARLGVPLHGSVYTITEVEDHAGRCFLRLKELPSDQVFEARAFRPVKTSETGMAVLKRLLLPGPARRRVREPAVSRRFERSAR